MDPTFSHQKAEQETFYYPTLYFLSFADKLTFVEKNFTHWPPGKYFGFETQKTILSNFYSGAAILIFVHLPANHNFALGYLCTKS